VLLRTSLFIQTIVFMRKKSRAPFWKEVKNKFLLILAFSFLLPWAHAGNPKKRSPDEVLLVLNANTTEFVTDTAAAEARRVASPGTEIVPRLSMSCITTFIRLVSPD